MKRLAALALALLPAASDRFDEAARAFDQGRFDAALATFRALVAEEGERASPPLLFDLALAALRAGELPLVESAAARAAASGDAEVAPLAAFLAGNLHFARSEAAETSEGPEPTGIALDGAIAEAEAARLAWQRVAVERGDWPAARRNVERALLRLAELRQRRAALQQRTPSPSPQPVAEPAEEPREDAGKEAPQEAAIEPSLEELSPAQIAQLAEKLAAAEKAKLELRRARRRQQPPDVERDW